MAVLKSPYVKYHSFCDLREAILIFLCLSFPTALKCGKVTLSIDLVSIYQGLETEVSEPANPSLMGIIVQ